MYRVDGNGTSLTGGADESCGGLIGGWVSGWFWAHVVGGPEALRTGRVPANGGDGGGGAPTPSVLLGSEQVMCIVIDDWHVVGGGGEVGGLAIEGVSGRLGRKVQPLPCSEAVGLLPIACRFALPLWGRTLA